ncbi:MAG: 50S ribosomal protein L20 [bacterium]|nr:50S ribosomal protein L20 [bacterium]
MSRVKRGTTHVKKRRKLLKQAKGFKSGRKNKIKLATTAVTKAGANAYRGRKEKKRTARSLWNVKINAGVRPHGLSYSAFIHQLNEKDIQLNRKVLSELAEKHPEVFEKLVKSL